MDVEDATAIAALSTAAMATTATAVAAAPLLHKAHPDDPIMASGPGLPDAITLASATPADMVPVPLAEQRVTTLPGPGINAAFLSQSLDPLPDAITVDRTDGIAADVSMLDQEMSAVTNVSRVESVTTTAQVWTAESAVVDTESEAGVTTSAAVAEVATATVVADSMNERQAIFPDGGSETMVARTQSVTQTEYASTAAVAMHAEASGGSVHRSSSSVSAVAVKSLVSRLQHVHASQHQSAAKASGEFEAESKLLRSQSASGHIMAHHPMATQGSGLSSDIVDDDSATIQHRHSIGSEGDEVDKLLTSGSGVPLVPNAMGSNSKLQQMHAALGGVS